MVSAELGDTVRRIPDGETGDRAHFIIFQQQMLDKAANLERVTKVDMQTPIVRQYRVKDPTKPVAFGPLRYASEAIASYGGFAALKAKGDISPATRFQVCLPTPLTVVASFIEETSQRLVEPAYDAQMQTELDQILRAIPHKELAIQWDVVLELVLVAGWTGVHYFDKSKSSIINKLGLLGNRVPADVELGYHFCYGDPGHKHVIEPTDLSLCVEYANAVTHEVRRPVNWIHMPVPRDRSDDQYFAPLRDLSVRKTTEIYLGLVHFTDGLVGTRHRMAVAQGYLPQFGVATECGFGRRSPEVVRELLSLHKAAALS